MSNTAIPNVPVTVPEFITPTLAAALLTLNKPYEVGMPGTNRPIRRQHVERLAADMLAGKWEVTNQAIGLAGPEGQEILIDGQHRLSAVVLAGKTDPGIRVLMLITKNLDASAAFVIDTNQGRNNGDVLAMKFGSRQPLVHAAALRLIHLYDEVPWSLHAWMSLRLSHATLLELAEKHPGIEAIRARTAKIGQAVPAAPLAAAAYIVSRDRSDIDFEPFLDGLKTGAGLAERSPILALRNYGFNALHSSLRREGPQMLSLTLKATNYWITNETRYHLRWSSSEPFTRLTAKPWSPR